MKRLIYVSTARDFVADTDVADIVAFARDFNRQHAITGYLLYNGYSFMQMLEGPSDKVNNLYVSITRDRRHYGVISLLHEPIDERCFADWSMGYVRTHAPRPHSVPDELPVRDVLHELSRVMPNRLYEIFRNFSVIGVPASV